MVLSGPPLGYKLCRARAHGGPGTRYAFLTLSFRVSESRWFMSEGGSSPSVFDKAHHGPGSDHHHGILQFMH
ncbi:hypothetical protein [Thermogymnomonas acidicola]|uniref:hypothetical protein n=1 Tax=Thermogymnomonas acidicola TaxID=399579 RepID=UPI00139688F4|nr:hypothetical protein [Thermogymnomonas acidicola]